MSGRVQTNNEMETCRSCDGAGCKVCNGSGMVPELTPYQKEAIFDRLDVIIDASLATIKTGELTKFASYEDADKFFEKGGL